MDLRVVKSTSNVVFTCAGFRISWIFYTGLELKKTIVLLKNQEMCNMNCEYDRDVIINKCLSLNNLKSNRRYIFFMNTSIKL